ncbi:LysR family transcriptional regulator [Enterovibrio sp. ZSDZ35]|uniref:LysR family transcriptional regulator n=1 Tax=Enterovibrio qingdaonensis TaxID=2899818 RepID=A0ABT5QJ59_9GAMM|nr:LysR family transcriptional regulator [Enterovibrio sp. ZSDZ35]MDD1780331.1 LysR family transcriptional regulator [Enterovibrio sp. ZSDZ35]
MDIDSLRSFLAIVDTGSFTRAAAQIHRTQSAISMQVKRLEEELGSPLFDRDKRPLSLSLSGQRLVSHARRLIASHDEALDAFKREDTTRPIRIGCPDDYAESLLPALLEQLRYQLKQNVTFDILCASSVRLRQRLDSGELDLAVVTRAPDSDEGWLLKHDKGVWVCGSDKRLISQRPLPLALFDKNCKFHSTALDGLGKFGIEVDLLTFTTSASTLKAVVRKGMAMSAMARSSVPDDLHIIDNGNLPPLPAIDIVIVAATHNHPLITPSLISTISNVFVDDDRQSANIA